MTKQREIILSCTHLSQSVPTDQGELHILRDVNLNLYRGEAVAVMGASGSGKSTLLGLLAGLDVASSGDIRLMDQSLVSLNEDQRAQLRRQRLGFVFQSFHLITALSALDNVMLALEVAGDKNPKDKAAEALNAVGLSERLSHYPGELSGGEQQRVAIARAFCIEPDLMLADEPTGNLDRTTGDQIADLLFRLQREKGVSLLMVTHDPSLAARCDRQLWLENGSLRETQEADSAEASNASTPSMQAMS